VALKNVATGVDNTDAVNVAQMKQQVITGNPYISGSGTGTAAQASGYGAVALGLGSVADTPYTISVGAPSINGQAAILRRITNVADGSALSDAATVHQLNGVSSSALQTTR
jgi:trimeric autotransporter adhesin